MKTMNFLLRKCKSLSRQLGRSASYSSLRSKSTREDLRGHSGNFHIHEDHINHQHFKIIYVGSTRKKYVISSKYLNHPLLIALIDKSKPNSVHNSHDNYDHDHGDVIIRCEVVLFDHLLWMLENSDPNLIYESLDELAQLYVF